MNEAAKKEVKRLARRAAFDCAESAAYGSDVDEMCATAWRLPSREYGNLAGAKEYFAAVFSRTINQETERKIEALRRRGY